MNEAINSFFDSNKDTEVGDVPDRTLDDGADWCLQMVSFSSKPQSFVIVLLGFLCLISDEGIKEGCCQITMNTEYKICLSEID